MSNALSHLVDPDARKAAIDKAFARHEAEQLLDHVRRTSMADRIEIAGQLATAFPDSLEAQRIREGTYGDRIPQQLLDNPPPLVREALIEVDRLPRDDA
jgi:hypothetical protein